MSSAAQRLASRGGRVGRIFGWLAVPVLAGVLAVTAWLLWGSWPDPEARPLPWKPDAIVVLGGGDASRSREAARLAGLHPAVPLLVSGDSGIHYQALLDRGVDAARLGHETQATSTVENARFLRGRLDELGADRVALVTNGFHAPRALAVFRREYPYREFAAAFEPLPAEPRNWHRHYQQRERLAALHYLVRHGIWSFD